MKLERGRADEVAAYTRSLLIMDFKGRYDAMRANESTNLGWANEKGAVELVAVRQALGSETNTWPR